MTKLLPPLANLIAVRDDDPQRLAGVARALRADSRFGVVAEPAPHWVVGLASLPGSEENPPDATASGLFFFEGRHRIGPWAPFAEMARGRPQDLHRFPGDFGCLLIEPSGDATVVRSCGGLVPVYRHEHAGRLVIGTHLNLLIEHGNVPPAPDALVWAIWMTGGMSLPDGKSPLENVQILPRGSWTRLGRNGQAVSGRYWNPEPSSLGVPTEAQMDARAMRLRELLLGHLDSELHPGGGNLLMLSSGVDSSSMAALAARTLKKEVWTWTQLPPPDGRLEAALSYIEPLVKEVGIRRTWRDTSLVASWHRITTGHLPFAWPVIHPGLWALREILREAPVRVLFGGEFADEICGTVRAYKDWHDATRFPELLAAMWNSTLPTGRAINARHWLGQRLAWLVRRPDVPAGSQLPAFVRGELREAYGEWWHRQRQRIAAEHRPNSFLVESARLQEGFVTQNWEACSALGVRRVMPFFTREVLELAFESHPMERVGPGVKKLLRRALVNDVPHRNLFRPDKDSHGAMTGVPEAAPLVASPLSDELVDPAWFGAHRERADYEAKFMVQLMAAASKSLADLGWQER